jgi:tetratricopeptide (TPR) repeat protein
MRALFLILGLALSFCGGAFADAVSDCNQEKDRELSIRGCTLIIEGQAKGDKGTAYDFRGIAYGNKGDYDRAIADLDQVIRLNPKNTYAYTDRGLAYGEKSNYDRAIADFDQAIRLNPEATKAYIVRGLA